MISPRQRIAFAHATSDDILLLASGAVASGKTAACSAAFGLFAATHPGDHLLLGRTESAVMRSCVRSDIGILSAVQEFGHRARVSGVDGKHVSINGGRSRIWVFGANSGTTSDRIAGSTFVSGLVDEITLLHDGAELWPMVWSRFRTPIRKIWATCNPGALRHWVRQQIILNPERYSARIESFTMDDNPGLAADVRASIEAALSGHHKHRYVDGLWVDATGLIYPDVPAGGIPLHPQGYFMGLDWAASGVFAAVLLCRSASSGRTHVVAERTWDHQERGALTDAEQGRRTAAWTRRYTDATMDVYGDPTTPTAFQDILRGYGLHWTDGKNDVLPGIQALASGFGTSALTVDPACVELLREASEYAWDAKAAEQGEDVPQKGGDHLLDALRYAWVTPPQRMAISQMRLWG